MMLKTSVVGTKEQRKRGADDEDGDQVPVKMAKTFREKNSQERGARKAEVVKNGDKTKGKRMRDTDDDGSDRVIAKSAKFVREKNLMKKRFREADVAKNGESKKRKIEKKGWTQKSSAAGGNIKKPKVVSC